MHDLHEWRMTAGDAIALQKKLSPRIIEAPPLDLSSVRLVAGVDVSSTKESPLLTAGVIVWDRDTGAIHEAVSAQMEAPFPYVPGLLSFRELPAVLQALRELSSIPDLILVDGHGRAHPRRLGIASHLGLFLDIPTVGVAKSLLCGEHAELPEARGSRAAILHRGEIVGMALRTKDAVSPVFVGVGNRIDLASAVEAVLACVRVHRLPEPTRLAHLHVNAVRRTGHGLPIDAPLQAPLL